MSPTAEPIHDATATFGMCQRCVHSGRPQAGIQYRMDAVAGHPSSPPHALSPRRFPNLACRDPSWHH